MHVFHTDGAPPSSGSSIFAISGCTQKSNAALVNSASPNTGTVCNPLCNKSALWQNHKNLTCYRSCDHYALFTQPKSKQVHKEAQNAQTILRTCSCLLCLFVAIRRTGFLHRDRCSNNA